MTHNNSPDKETQPNIHQSHSGSGDNIGGDKNVYNIINHPVPPLPLTSLPQNIPHRGTQTFVGRSDELQEIAESLNNNSQLLITSAVKSLTGMGGVGKTELALQYSLRFQEQYQGGICWLEARSQEISLQILSFCRIHFNLNPPDEFSVAERINYCWSHWPEGEVLLIFDDVQSYQRLKPYLPPKNDKFKVIVTSRQRLGQLNQLKLKVLEPAEALELLK
ncbi:MAG: NB-ARC domain-containing protein, partial [Microcystaceae cyanobacterium]